MTPLRKSRRKPRLSPAKLVAMKAMLKESHPDYTKIAKKLRVCVTTVDGYASRMGLPTRREKALKHYEEIEKLVREMGQAGAARKLGVTRQCVHGCLARLARMRGGSGKVDTGVVAP